MEPFSSLHHHSTFSYLDGYGTPAQHVAAAVELGMPALAHTEHGNITSHVQLEKAARAAGIQPIFGCELYTGAVEEDKRSRWKWHLTVLAMNQQGYRNLLRLVSAGWREGFYYEPTVSGEMLAENSEGLIVLSGCAGSKMACDLVGGKGVPAHEVDVRAAERTALRFKRLLGDRFYLECQAFPELERTRSINQAWEQISSRTGIPLVVTGDVHYPAPEDNKMQVLLHAIDRKGRNNTFEKQEQSWGYNIRLAPFTAEAILRKAVGTGLSKRAALAALAATNEIAGRCRVEIPKFQEMVFPGKTPPDELLRQWCRRGWRYRGLEKLRGEAKGEYVRRVKRELDLIELKGFANYFLVVSDMVRWAKNQGIPVGPARGSAAASLVCYLLRITEVDPMRFPNLLFERFIDINRHDLPDIDLDFDDERRGEVRQYLVDQYGEDRVGNIGTFTRYKGKNSLEDVARVHQVPLGQVEIIKDMLIERSSGDLRGASTIEDSIAMFPKVREVFEANPVLYQAQQLEGNLRGMSVHAAGLVVANEPLTNSVAVYSRRDSKTGDTANVLSIDKYDAEYIGALKLDVLGLKTMGMIRRCLDMVGMSLEELYAVPLDDPTVYQAFRNNEVIGVFQFDGRAMRSVNREVKPDNFQEICDINALARPGPLHSGAASEYIQVKHGLKGLQLLDPRFDKITATTHGQVVYQEQILQAVRDLANFSWEEAAAIRKLISKKQGEQAFNRVQDRFLEGAIANGVKPAAAARIWKQLVTSGAYAFNAPHCVSYGMLAYWTMWLKVQHPLAFYCTSLQKYDPKKKGFDLLREAAARGIEVVPPDPQNSKMTWSVSEDRLLAGLEQIPNIGGKVASQIVGWREEHGPKDRGCEWRDFLAVKGIGPKTITKIAEFAEQEDPFGIQLLSRQLTETRRWLWQRGEEMDLPFPSSRSEDVPYEAKRGSHVWLGVVRVRNLKDLYELHRSRTGKELDPTEVREPQFINWAVITGEDETGPLTITVHRYRGLYDKYKDLIWELNPEKDLLLVRGVKRNEYRRAIYAEQLWVIDSKTRRVRRK